MNEKDPLAIAELLIAHPKIPFLGCEHALIVTASLLTALKNDGTLDISNEQIPRLYIEKRFLAFNLIKTILTVERRSVSTSLKVHNEIY
jgi:hypothetical protein